MQISRGALASKIEMVDFPLYTKNPNFILNMRVYAPIQTERNYIAASLTKPYIQKGTLPNNFTSNGMSSKMAENLDREVFQNSNIENKGPFKAQIKINIPSNIADRAEIDYSGTSDTSKLLRKLITPSLKREGVGAQTSKYMNLFKSLLSETKNDADSSESPGVFEVGEKTLTYVAAKDMLGESDILGTKKNVFEPTTANNSSLLFSDLKPRTFDFEWGFPIQNKTQALNLLKALNFVKMFALPIGNYWKSSITGNAAAGKYLYSYGEPCYFVLDFQNKYLKQLLNLGVLVISDISVDLNEMHNLFYDGAVKNIKIKMVFKEYGVRVSQDYQRNAASINHSKI